MKYASEYLEQELSYAVDGGVNWYNQTIWHYLASTYFVTEQFHYQVYLP